MEKKNQIKNYLLEKGISEEDRKRRFEIAWDIWKNFEDILFELKQDFLKSFIRKIKNSKEFKDYKIFVHPKLLNVNKGKGRLCISKKDWILGDDYEVGILCYSIGAYYEKIFDLYCGITKYDENTPFSGNWMNTKIQKVLNPEILTILNEIYNKLGGKEKDWKSDEYDIAWKWLDLFDKENFYSHITLIPEQTTSGLNELFNKFVELKNSTEELIDEFVEIYKNQIK